MFHGSSSLHPSTYQSVPWSSCFLAKVTARQKSSSHLKLFRFRALVFGCYFQCILFNEKVFRRNVCLKNFAAKKRKKKIKITTTTTTFDIEEDREEIFHFNICIKYGVVVWLNMYLKVRAEIVTALCNNNIHHPSYLRLQSLQILSNLSSKLLLFIALSVRHL